MDDGTRFAPGLGRDARVQAGWQLRAYRRLSRLLVLRSYRGKVFLLAFATTHILLLVAKLPTNAVWPSLLVTLGAALLGTTLAVLGLGVMLAPVRSSSQALAAYRTEGTRPTLPIDIDDEGGQLLADVQHTLMELDEVLAETRDMASRDGLTGLLNRREGERRLREDLAAARSNGSAFAVLALDADGLKDVNDRWGHAVGDAYIRHLSSVIVQNVDANGWVARWGGDEFVVRCADEIEPHACLERIQTTLAASPVPVSSHGGVVCRITGGVATSRSSDGPADLVDRADSALYHGKRRRSAEIVVTSDQPPEVEIPGP